MATSNFLKSIRDIMRNDEGVNGDAQRLEQIVWILFLKVYDTKEDYWKLENTNYKSIIPDELSWKNWAVDKKDGKALTGSELLDFVNNKLFPGLKELEVDNTTPKNKSIVKYVFTDLNNYMKNGILLRQVINIIDNIQVDDKSEEHEFSNIYETMLKELQSAGSSGEFYTPRPVTRFMVKMTNPVLGEKIGDLACGTGGFLTSTLDYLQGQEKTAEDVTKYNKSVYGIELKSLPYLLCVTNLLLHDVDNPMVEHRNSFDKKVTDYKENEKFDLILMNPPYGGSLPKEYLNSFPVMYSGSETADLFMVLIMYRLKKTGRAAVILPDGFLFGSDNTKINIKKKLLSEFNLHTIVRMPSSVFAPYTSITTNILFFDAGKSTENIWFYRIDMPEGYKNFSKTKPMKDEHFKEVEEWWNNRKEIIDSTENDNGTITYKSKCYPIKEIEESNYYLDLCGYPHEEEIILEPKEFIKKYEEQRAKLNSEIDNTLSKITEILNKKD